MSISINFINARYILEKYCIYMSNMYINILLCVWDPHTCIFSKVFRYPNL